MLYHLYSLANLVSRLGVTVNGCDEDVCDAGDSLPTVKADSGQVASVLRIVFMVVGVVAFIYLVMAGLKLMTSLGENPEAVKEARQSIIFAAVGLAVALSAELIVVTVLKNL